MQLSGCGIWLEGIELNFFKNNNKSTVSVNGKTYTVTGKNIVMINDKVYVDGKEITSAESQTINIIVEGNANQVQCNGSVEVRGDVNGNIDCGGSVVCGNITGDIDCGGSVTCSEVKGDIDAGGSVFCR